MIFRRSEHHRVVFITEVHTCFKYLPTESWLRGLIRILSTQVTLQLSDGSHLIAPFSTEALSLVAFKFKKLKLRVMRMVVPHLFPFGLWKVGGVLGFHRLNFEVVLDLKFLLRTLEWWALGGVITLGAWEWGALKACAAAFVLIWGWLQWVKKKLTIRGNCFIWRRFYCVKEGGPPFKSFLNEVLLDVLSHLVHKFIVLVNRLK